MTERSPYAQNRANPAPDRPTDKALKFIETNRHRPFFLYLSHYAALTPLQAKPELIERYHDKLRPGLKQNNPTYAAMVESMDQSVGRVMEKLDALGIAGRTIVFFTSQPAQRSRRNSESRPPDARPGRHAPRQTGRLAQFGWSPDADVQPRPHPRRREPMRIAVSGVCPSRDGIPVGCGLRCGGPADRRGRLRCGFFDFGKTELEESTVIGRCWRRQVTRRRTRRALLSGTTSAAATRISPRASSRT